MYTKVYSFFTISFTLLALSGCSDSYENTSHAYNPAWVTISVPSTNPYTYDKELLHMSGSAFISPDWSRCCSGSYTDTGVTVRWANTTTDISGSATQYIQYGYILGYPYIKSHSWAADVPLAMGSNSISITASDPEYSDTEKITVVRTLDTTPPYVTYTDPENNESNVSIYTTKVFALFNEDINCSALPVDVFSLEDDSNVLVAGNLSCYNNVLDFDVLQTLASSTLYTVTIKAGVKDSVDLNMSEDYQWSFTTY